MSSKVILYDLPSQQGTSWSLNPLKTRMVLNFKGVDYTTEWVEFPDVNEKIKSLGVAPNDKNAPGYWVDYSIPAVRYDDGSYGMESWAIAQELEKRYSSPSLHLDDPIVIKIRDHVSKLIMPIVFHFMPKIVHLVPESSQPYFNETREKMFGMPLQEVERTKATDEAWEGVKAPAKETGDLLRKNGGPFFLGETVSYADFIFVSVLHCLKRVDDGLYQRFLALDPTFPKIYEASKQWLEKDT